MTPDASLPFGAALVLGLGGSVHCFAMCGPLACTAQGPSEGRWQRALLYHCARIGAYSVLGAALGAASGGAAHLLSLPIERALPWALAALLVVTALVPVARLKRLPMPRLASAMLASAARLRAKLSPKGQALLLGALTPLLPCGLLYGIAVGALATGGPMRGALLLGAFALGAVPALALAQWSSSRLFGTRASAWWTRALPLVAAVVIVARAALASTHHACH